MDYMKYNNCGCQDSSPSSICYDNYDALQDMPLAMAYIPWQQWQNVYDGAKGLENGTIFEELIFPFLCASPTCRNKRCNCSSSEARTRNCTTAPIRRDMSINSPSNMPSRNSNQANCGRNMHHNNSCGRRCDL